ncbi:MAG: glycosyltransferase family 4 protein [Geminicoccaceae bacterium]
MTLQAQEPPGPTDERPTIAIDARYASGPTCGIERYTMNLLPGLAELEETPPVLIIRHPGQDLPEAVIAAKTFSMVDEPSSRLSPWSQWKLARRLKKRGIDVMVSADVYAPLVTRPRQVITLHDVTPIRCRDRLKSSLKARFWWLWGLWLFVQTRGAWKVLTVSQWAARDIADCLHLKAGKLAVVPNSVMPGQAARNRKPGSARLLYVGRMDGNKNVESCVAVLGRLVAQGYDATLTIVGKTDARYPQASEAIDALGLRERVTITGHVSEEQLRHCYAEADVFLFLSVYEGFGLPPLEAMAHGLPVVASNRTAMTEVLGDAAFLVDPDDLDSAAEAVARILDDPAMADRLAKAGLERARAFSPARQARALLAAVGSSAED